jgi:hypothetical protein
MTHRKIQKYGLIQIFFLSLSVGLISCSSQSQPFNGKNAISNLAAQDQTLVGRYAKITYPSFTVEISYLSTQNLRWKSINAKGQITEETESISYQKLNDHLYFISWIEKDGFTVSQVIDTEKMEVNSFATSNAPDLPSGRRAMILQGGLKFISQKK